MRSLLLVAHGSRDPRAQVTTRALAQVVAATRPGLDVRVSFLELAQPSPAEVLRDLDGAVVVPLLLTNAYHGRIDLPAQVAGFDVTLTGPLGAPSEHLLAGLISRLHNAVSPNALPAAHASVPRRAYNSVVMVAAGTTVAAARTTVEQVAQALGERLDVPVAVAYAAAGTTGAQAVGALGGRVAVASYFLACGRLYTAATASALSAGAVAVAEPLGASWHLAQLILDRYDSALRLTDTLHSGSRLVAPV